MNIQEIAKRAGASVATVSRAFNYPELVSDETRARVLAVAEEVGYRPNLLGRHLRRMETRILLVMLSTPANAHLARIVRSLDREARRSSYHIMLCVTGDDPGSERRYLDFARNKLADGVIFLTSTLSGGDMRTLLTVTPVVQCGERTGEDDTPWVGVDDEKAAFEATEHLLNSGRRRIVFFGVENDFLTTRLRFAGYKRALAAHGIAFDARLTLRGNYGYRNATRVTEAFLRRGIPFDGMFSISDYMAVGAIRAMSAAGVKTPDDCAVIGFDNVDVAEIVEPTLSTVAQPQDDMGKAAFSLVHSLLKKEPAGNIVLPHKLILRQSTK
ncbi:LacI family transcriptional regulator [Clostridia bacterium]|nr:LacI family transcriptional regulator [Clostridia bacterium]